MGEGGTKHASRGDGWGPSLRRKCLPRCGLCGIIFLCHTNLSQSIPRRSNARRGTAAVGRCEVRPRRLCRLRRTIRRAVGRIPGWGMGGLGSGGRSGVRSCRWVSGGDEGGRVCRGLFPGFRRRWSALTPALSRPGGRGGVGTAAGFSCVAAARSPRLEPFTVRNVRAVPYPVWARAGQSHCRWGIALNPPLVCSAAQAQGEREASVRGRRGPGGSQR